MKLIKLNPDHYIVVDGQPTGVTYYLDDTNAIRKGIICDRDYWAKRPEYRKITHSTQPIEQYYGASDGSVPYVYHKIQPLDLSEVEALIGEVDVEKKAKKWLNTHYGAVLCGYAMIDGFTDGYNQALEDNKEKKYTEEDMKVAITQAFLSGVERLEDFERVQEMILDNIKPKTEWEVEFVDGKLKLK